MIQQLSFSDLWRNIEVFEQSEVSLRSLLKCNARLHSFQSRDRLEDLEGKTSIVNLFHNRKYLDHISKEKNKDVNKMQVLAICNPY